MRKILIISVGGAPQIVTETIWALLNPQHPNVNLAEEDQEREPFIPEVIHLVTTTFGLDKIEQYLIGNDGKIAEIFHEKGLDQPDIELNIPELDGKKLHDIRSLDENVEYANKMTEIGRTYAEDDNTVIHVSLAGGRKTMSYYAGATISLFGRYHDELSHVLVEPEEYEQCQDFWWPSQENPREVTHRNGSIYNADDAFLDLSIVPFVPLREVIPAKKAFPQGEVNYRHIIRVAREALLGHKGLLVLDERTLVVGRYEFKMANKEFALYCLLAEAAKYSFRWRGAGKEGIGSECQGWLTPSALIEDYRALASYFEYYEKTSKECASTAEERHEFFKKCMQSEKEADTKELTDYFRPIKSRLLKIFDKSEFPPNIKNLFRVTELEGQTASSRFGLDIEPSQIDFIAGREDQ